MRLHEPRLLCAPYYNGQHHPYSTVLDSCAPCAMTCSIHDSLGRRRTGQDPTAVEALLPEHAGADLRGGL